MKSKKFLVILVSVLLVVILVGLAGMWYVSSHTFVDGKAYKNNAASLDLRQKDITAEHFEAVQAAFPDCQILWSVPFQGGTQSSDSRQLTITSLTDGDLDALAYFTDLQTVDARGCTDYAQLTALQAQHPELAVLYTVTIDGQEYAQDTTSLTVSSLTEEEAALAAYLPELTSVNASDCSDYAALAKLQEVRPDCAVTYSVPVFGKDYAQDTAVLSLTGASTSELMQQLQYLPRLTKVELMDPVCDGDGLLALVEAYPAIEFYWEADVLGLRVTSTDTELDLSEVELSSLEEAAEALVIFPALERVYFGYNPYDNETMAAFREEMRDQYKVVWSLDVGYIVVNSDDTWFMPGKVRQGLTQEQAYNLRYCEDMVCIDVGHKPIYTCEWAAFMPHLRYLIIAFTAITDISPLANLTELVYLEACGMPLADYAPLATMTGLQDLNISNTRNAVNPEALTQMPWLVRLWWAWSPYEEAELQEMLPNTELMVQKIHLNVTKIGWRYDSDLGDHAPLYKEMRDYLGMDYMW